MLRVGLNLVFLVPGRTGGMEVYARELVPRLAAHGVEPVALVNREARGEDFGVEARVVPVDASDRKQWVLGEQLHVPRQAARLGCDVVHSLASTAPLHGRFVRVTTIHDLHYKLVPDAHFGLRGLGMRVLVPAAARRSHRIVVDAASTREDLREHLGVTPGKVDVVPLAAAPPAVAPAEAAGLRARLGLSPDRPVVLAVSAKRPHKNLPRLVEAMAGLDAALAIPGYSTPHEEEIRAHAQRLGVEVVLPSWLPAEDLEGLYALATCVAFPSLYEGFGLPVLEGMLRGVPVITSARGSLAEVAGDAALTIDPEDPAAIRAALARVLGDPAERDRLREAGLRRARQFSWERTAAATVASYERAVAER